MATKKTTDLTPSYKSTNTVSRMPDPYRFEMLCNLVKLFGSCPRSQFEKYGGRSAEELCEISDLGFAAGKDYVYESQYLRDNSLAFNFLGISLPRYEYTNNEITKGKGNRHEETKARAAVRQWLNDHNVQKPDTVMRRLRELQEKLIRAAMMTSAIKTLALIKNG